ncbi:hypothetical protein [Cellulosimicrobium sp. TH-20]|uniref:hypothetical protein n=1 Tax=Cellulosimicrobium sp. TH-20 TaxID=1980001 RepID=UPI0011A5BD79|nr:hypothetical protein [Cellulosimicrobium sp. TH-20]
MFRRKPRSAPKPNPNAPTVGTAVFLCSLAPTDSLTVRGFSGTAPGVALFADDSSGSEVEVILSPVDARRLAAAILNAADNAQGNEPLASLTV